MASSGHLATTFAMAILDMQLKDKRKNHRKVVLQFVHARCILYFLKLICWSIINSNLLTNEPNELVGWVA